MYLAFWGWSTKPVWGGAGTVLKKPVKDLRRGRRRNETTILAGAQGRKKKKTQIS